MITANITAARQKRSPAPQNGSSSRLLNRTATGVAPTATFVPRNAQTAARSPLVFTTPRRRTPRRRSAPDRAEGERPRGHQTLQAVVPVDLREHHERPELVAPARRVAERDLEAPAPDRK